MKQKVSEIEGLKVLGRCGMREEAISCFWTASGIAFDVRASQLWLELRASYEIYDLWLDIEIDGALIQRRMLDKGEQRVCIFRGMDPGVVKHVRILRDTQAMPEDTVSRIDFLSVETDGSFVDNSPVEEENLLLEVIGDSITSGEGLCGDHDLMDWVSHCFSATKTYEYQVAKALHADLCVLSQSGWGAFQSYDGDQKNALPPYYQKLAGVLRGEEDQSYDAGVEWSSYQPILKKKYKIKEHPDVILINLGTNDSNLLPEQGEKLRENFAGRVYDFMKELGRMHPKAHIFWCYGMIGDPLMPQIRSSVERIREEEEDGGSRFAVIELENTEEKELGSRLHPGSPSHKKAAEKILKEIEPIL